MSVLSAEGPRCDSTEWVWGIFLAVGIANRSMAVEALTAWAVPPAQCSGGGFGDRNVMEPRPVEMTLRCRSAEPGMRDAVCNPRQLCLWGCFAAVGTAGGITRAPISVQLPLCCLSRAGSGWEFQCLPSRCGAGSAPTAVLLLLGREHLCIPHSCSTGSLAAALLGQLHCHSASLHTWEWAAASELII